MPNLDGARTECFAFAEYMRRSCQLERPVGMVSDGVYRRSIDGTPEFVEVPEPTDKGVASENGSQSTLAAGGRKSSGSRGGSRPL